ncbi:hypothetical protein LWI29_003828 [Acer saccharum]|uniref:Uncharacterized protein n=1 Tax=Acer saccharum TaxID=4024 RepID=A0AA39VMY3_ACESA|nr:hypothetical protein LWI29_003828 [Acer saccharum]
MPEAEDFKHWQACCRSVVVLAAPLRLLTPLQQAVGKGPLPLSNTTAPIPIKSRFSWPSKDRFTTSNRSESADVSALGCHVTWRSGDGEVLGLGDGVGGGAAVVGVQVSEGGAVDGSAQSDDEKHTYHGYVGGGAEIERKVDTAHGGEAGGKCRVDAGGSRSSFFQAPASLLAVNSGNSSSVKSLIPLQHGRGSVDLKYPMHGVTLMTTRPHDTTVSAIGAATTNMQATRAQ